MNERYDLFHMLFPDAGVVPNEISGKIVLVLIGIMLVITIACIIYAIFDY